MEGKRGFRLMTAAEKEKLQAGCKEQLEWERKVRNSYAFPEHTIHKAREVLNVTANYLSGDWYIVEKKK